MQQCMYVFCMFNGHEFFFIWFDLVFQKNTIPYDEKLSFSA